MGTGEPYDLGFNVRFLTTSIIWHSGATTTTTATLICHRRCLKIICPLLMVMYLLNHRHMVLRHMEKEPSGGPHGFRHSIRPNASNGPSSNHVQIGSSSNHVQVDPSYVGDLDAFDYSNSSRSHVNTAQFGSNAGDTDSCIPMPIGTTSWYPNYGASNHVCRDTFALRDVTPYSSSLLS
ncbi:hypothetical protein PVK06_026931 [Gossypium arboreum]|uniref:Uncharacterized protein n=1 Tax=Gossypium arboreum TaxID=29729 RepID=A0ABR0NZ21_GOSAR|nr:hypothetical protein PVK06_026931 [Gossypium arboreum]